MNQAMPERLAVFSRGYTCRGSPAAVKPESSSSACLQVRESRDFSRVEVSKNETKHEQGRETTILFTKIQKDGTKIEDIPRLPTAAGFSFP